MKLKNIWLYFEEHINEIITSVLFIIIVYLIYTNKTYILKEENIQSYIMPFVALFGIFLAWLQFMFHKYNKKKEAAVTYFPRPLELEKIESEIDQIINFWKRKEPLDNYEVKLMTNKNIDNDEYRLIWKKLSIPLRKEILDSSCLCCKKDEEIDISILDNYDDKYNPFIDELYRQVRRKLNAYLNQIEAYCLAVNKGNIDLKSSKELYSHKFYSNFIKARPYIEMIRNDIGEKAIYLEFENVLKKWGKL
jgi:hypothetical protein